MNPPFDPSALAQRWTPADPCIVGVLLAAGRARRHGADKLSEPLPDGSTVALRSARALMAGGCDEVVAVVRPDQSALAHQLVAEGCRTVCCEQADDGMGHSLAAGVQATRHAAGWVVALADMPMVRAESVACVSVALRSRADIVVLQHAGQRGHPVGWSSRWADALSCLTGDQGARHILRAQADALTIVPVDDPGVLFDIDTPDALAALRASWPAVPAAS